MKTHRLLLVCLCVFASVSCVVALDCTPLVISPDVSVLDFGSIPFGASKTLVLNVRNDASRLSPLSDKFEFFFKQSGLNSTAVLIDPSGFNRIPAGGGTLTVKVTVPANSPLGEISATNSILTLSRQELTGSKALCQIHVSAKIVKPLDFNPGANLSFDTVASGITKSVSLTIHANASVRIDNIVTSPADYSISGLTRFPFTINEGTSQDLSVNVKPTITSGSLPGTLTISLESADRQKLVDQIISLATSVSTSAPTQPDLIPEIVGSPTITPPQPGQPKSKVTFQLKVNNPGSASLLCQGRVLLDDVLITTITINPISGGSNNQQQVSFLTNKSGSHQLKVQVDTDGVNQESNENNNEVGPVALTLP